MILNRVYNQDCIGFMKKIDPGSVDVIVTSPPYNLEKKYTKYKDNVKRADYIEWIGYVANESSRVLKSDGSFFLNIGGKPSDPWFAFDVAKEFSKHFILQNVIHWVKHISLPQDESVKTHPLNGDISFGNFKPINTNVYLNQCHEYIFHFTKSGRILLDKLSIGVPYQHKSNVTRWKAKGRDIRDRGNVWFIRYPNKQGQFQKILHPAEFPEKLPYLCIKLHGIKKDMVVYDPFIGIGTTALASIELGVNYIGTDIDEKYVEIANNRIKQRKTTLNQFESHSMDNNK